MTSPMTDLVKVTRSFASPVTSERTSSSQQDKQRNRVKVRKVVAQLESRSGKCASASALPRSIGITGNDDDDDAMFAFNDAFGSERRARSLGGRTRNTLRRYTVTLA